MILGFDLEISRVMLVAVLGGLLGILMMNITGFGLLMAAYTNPAVEGGATGIDLTTYWIIQVGFEGTMRGIFSILFGAGIVLLTERMELGEPDERGRRRPVGTGDLVEVAGVRLHLRESGPKDAPVVILIHGFGGSLHTWEPWAQVLASDHRVIRFDLPGSGLSEPDPTGDYADARSEQLLLNILPRPIAERLKEGQRTIADVFPDVIVLVPDPMMCELKNCA